MKASEVVQTHSQADVAMLFQLWAAGATIPEIAERFGVVHSTVSKWVGRYKLPRRLHPSHADAPAPTPEDDAASLSSLALSPWVEERARVVRERHYLERRSEPEETARAKAASWRRGDTIPRGASYG
jgi:transposase-like protein